MFISMFDVYTCVARPIQYQWFYNCYLWQDI